jgi:hypothetical protein
MPETKKEQSFKCLSEWEFSLFIEMGMVAINREEYERAEVFVV